jgi:hypothetical protein
MEDRAMRNTIYLLTVISAIAISTIWFVVPSGASIHQQDVGLEQVANPFGGTRTQWDLLTEDGGVQKHNRWHGLPVSKAKLRFDSAGNVLEVAISTDQTKATVREIRESINSLCGFRETDWRMTTSGSFPSGSAENSRCKANYLPEDDKYWAYSIKRQAKVAT